MRKIYLLIISLVFICRLSAQNTHIARHSSIDRTNNIVNINHKFYYIEDVSFGCCGDSINLVACDNNGNVLFKSTIVTFDLLQMPKIKVTKDKCLLLSWSSNYSCDVIRYKNYITKMDTTGNLIFNALINQTTKYFTSYIQDFVGADDSSIYACSLDTIYHYSKNGLLQSVQNFSNSPINSIENLNNGNIIINSGVSPNCLNTILSFNLNIISQNVCPFQISKFSQSANGLLIGSQYGQLIRFSSNMAQTYTSQIYCNDFALRSDSIFYIGKNVNSLPFYAVANSSLTTIYSNNSNITNYTPTGIVATSDGVKSVGFGTSTTQKKMSFTSFFNLSLLGQFNTQPDLAVINTSLTNFSPWNTQSQFLVCWMDVMVKNNGQQNIQKFYLNNLTPNFWCWFTLHKEYNTNLAPGDSTVVQTGSFVIGYNNGFNSLIGSAITATPCVFSSVPNGQIDADPTNDSFCKAFTVGYVGFEENTITPSNIKLYPNPFNTELKIESSELILNFKLLDVLGKLVQEGNVETKTLNIKTENLLKGIYFIQIQTRLGIQTTKVVKE